MKNITVDLRKFRLPILIGLCVIAALYTVIHGLSRYRSSVLADDEAIPAWTFEPEVAQDKDDSYYFQLPNLTLHSVGDVMQLGKEIPIQLAYNDPDWERQAFKSYWHRSVGRWSYVPVRVHYAMHRMFVTYPTASVFYDFIHNLGIAEESKSFYKSPQDGPYTNILMVVMQTKVEKVLTLGNQVVVVGKPSLTGLQALRIPVKALEPDNPNESILFELVTSEGDEIDIDTITYVSD